MANLFTEAKLSNNNLVLLQSAPVQGRTTVELAHLFSNFYGQIRTSLKRDTNTVYVVGDVTKAFTAVHPKVRITNLYVLTEYSFNIPDAASCHCPHLPPFQFVAVGQVPIIVNGVGAYWRQCFDPARDYFADISREHEFQNLTLNTKPGEAFRTGIYITRVTQEPESEDLRFRLLRCSSNFTGPTDNLRATDEYLSTEANKLVKSCFTEHAELNHVLAQTYHNHVDPQDPRREKKAVIARHSDKTKDMARRHLQSDTGRDSLMAFCTFYEGYRKGAFEALPHVQPCEEDRFDFVYKQQSALTRLRFRLKSSAVQQAQYQDLIQGFDVTLYPNSMFAMSLETNRLYSHEIVPSVLAIKDIPVRMGYVIRTSATEALYKRGKEEEQEEKQGTHVQVGNRWVPLQTNPDPKEVEDLRALYARENVADEQIDYAGVGHLWSMNSGDLLPPIL